MKQFSEMFQDSNLIKFVSIDSKNGGLWRFVEDVLARSNHKGLDGLKSIQRMESMKFRLKMILTKRAALAVTLLFFHARVYAQTSTASLPTAGNTLFLLGQEVPHDVTDYSTAALAQGGDLPAGYSTYWSFNDLNNNPQTSSALQGANSDPQGVSFTPMIYNDYPCSYMEVGLSWHAMSPEAAFENSIASGQYSFLLDPLAKYMYNHPTMTFLLRIGYENNVPIEGWTGAVNGSGTYAATQANPIDPNAFPKAFHYIKYYLKGLIPDANGHYTPYPCKNFLAVYHPEVGYLSCYPLINNPPFWQQIWTVDTTQDPPVTFLNTVNTPAIAASYNMYPDTTGNDTDVDVVGFSIWNAELGISDEYMNYGQAGNGGFVTLGSGSSAVTMCTAWYDDIQWLQAHNPTNPKPMMICESSPHSPVGLPYNTSNTAYFLDFIADYFNVIEYPAFNFRAFVYINTNWESTADWGGASGWAGLIGSIQGWRPTLILRLILFQPLVRG